MIARNPKVAIYDEPDTGIDLWTIGPMVDLLKREQKENNTTTIVVQLTTGRFSKPRKHCCSSETAKLPMPESSKAPCPLLEDLSVCTFSNTCEGENDVRCYR